MQARRIELFVIIAIIGCVGIVYALTQTVIAPSTPTLSNTETEQKIQQVPTTTITYPGVEGKNALELLKASHVVKTQEFAGAGEFVSEINGVAPDANHFWSFYVNGEQSQVGASQYITKSTDTIEWKLEKIN